MRRAITDRKALGAGGKGLLTRPLPSMRVARRSFFCAEQVRQLGDVDCNPPRLIAGHQMRRRSPAGFFLEIDIRQRIAVRVPDDEAILA